MQILRGSDKCHKGSAYPVNKQQPCSPYLDRPLRSLEDARKARKGVNPFTGEEMMFKAKPATKVVKATVLKGLKDMV